MNKYWIPPKLWPNKTAVIIGGGPSLKNFDLTGISRFNTIVVNKAFNLHPQADILFYADTRWWRWNHDEIKQVFKGARIVTASSAAAHALAPGVLRVGRDNHFKAGEGAPLSLTPGHVAGNDGGYMAIDLAVQMGVSRIILLGFDMQFDGDVSHWHGDHEVRSQLSDYVERFAPSYPKLVQALHKRGIEVIRCTPSALTCVPEMAWQDALKLNNRPIGPVS